MTGEGTHLGGGGGSEHSPSSSHFIIQKQASRPMARYALLGVTGITLLGLLKLNLTGPGITETYKSLWREQQEEKEGKKK